MRGSIPTPGPHTVRVGGNTSCVELAAADGRRLILDAGTGLRHVGRAPEPLSASGADGADGAVPPLLVTHAHADHLHGFPFFAPLHADGAALTVHAAPWVLDAVAAAATALLSPPLFPIAIGAAPERVRFAPLGEPGAPMELGGFVVRTIELSHPGGAAGFRIDDPLSGRSVAYLPDNELAAVEGVCGGRRTLLEAVADVDLLVHDATYLPAELPERRGWGHSSYAEAVRLAADAGARRLLLFHHAPERTDDQVERIGRIAAALGLAARGAPAVTVACERDEYVLAG